MRKITLKKASRNHTLICLGILALAFFILISTAGAAPYAYVTSWAGNDISVIDTASNTVTTTIHGVNYSDAIAASPDGKRVYVTNAGGSNTVSVIDTNTNTVIATVEVNAVESIAVTPDGKKVYVAGSSSIDVIDTETNRVIATLDNNHTEDLMVL